MNIHHLELFYYVAKHGGITEAVRNIPYGIQQPAVSAQIIQLEEYLGTALFQRRPFSLTSAGQELYEFIQPFFSGIMPMAEKLRGGIAQHLRIGASEVVLRDHLPEILQIVRQKHPKLKFTLREGYQADLEMWLQQQEIDLAVTLLERKPSGGMQSLPLLTLPLVLLVPKPSRLQSAAELWERDRIEDTLISLPGNEAICKNFQQGLSRLGVDWFTGIEVSSLELVQTYVAKGYGIGLAVLAPKAKLAPGLRCLPLEGFAPVTFGAIWMGKPSVLLQDFFAEMKSRVETLLQC